MLYAPTQSDKGYFRWYNGGMSAIVTMNPKVMHGVPCFAGTRVTVQSLFDHLEAGYTVDGFLEQFPTVKREQVIELLEQLRQRAERSALAVSA
jgi:uncharacterized protein (DUF433 family)